MTLAMGWPIRSRIQPVGFPLLSTLTQPDRKSKLDRAKPDNKIRLILFTILFPFFQDKFILLVLNNYSSRGPQLAILKSVKSFKVGHGDIQIGDLGHAGRAFSDFMDEFTEFFWIVRLSQYCDRAILVIPDTTVERRRFPWLKTELPSENQHPAHDRRQSFWPFSCSYPPISLTRTLLYYIIVGKERKRGTAWTLFVQKAIS